MFVASIKCGNVKCLCCAIFFLKLYLKDLVFTNILRGFIIHVQRQCVNIIMYFVKLCHYGPSW